MIQKLKEELNARDNEIEALIKNKQIESDNSRFKEKIIKFIHNAFHQQVSDDEIKLAPEETIL